eukprot:COSAG01_NODE_45972_length_404_cov_1.504918_1_plen_57_part_10
MCIYQHTNTLTYPEPAPGGRTSNWALMHSIIYPQRASILARSVVCVLIAARASAAQL